MHRKINFLSGGLPNDQSHRLHQSKRVGTSLVKYTNSFGPYIKVMGDSNRLAERWCGGEDKMHVKMSTVLTLKLFHSVSSIEEEERGFE